MYANFGIYFLHIVTFQLPSSESIDISIKILPEPSCSKLKMPLVNEMLKFQMYYLQEYYHFLPKNVRSFCSAKVPYSFSAKHIAKVDFVSTIRLDKSSTNDFIKLTML